MKMNLNKIKTATITLILMLTFSATILALPVVSAHDPPVDIPTYTYLTVEPSPIGVGQPVTIVYWLDKLPMTAAGLGGDRWTFTIEVTTPGGAKENMGPYTSDPVGGGWAQYTPTQVGTYTFKCTFNEKVLSQMGPTGILGSDSIYIGDTFLTSFDTAILTVQQDPIPNPPSYPLPTEYWSRPIEGQNTNWYTVASNWLSGSHTTGKVQIDGTAPNSPHIMWTRPLQDGGVVGGSRVGLDGTTYYDGSQYENKFMNPIIMNGRLYYTLPLSDSGTGGGYICVDLQTGEEIWCMNYEGSDPSIGQIYDYESMNQHGAINGYLWSVPGRGDSPDTPWNAYDAVTGTWLYGMTNVPSGTEVYGPNGEILRYVLNANNNWLALWDSTQHDVGLHGDLGTSSSAYQWRPIGKVVDMSDAYAWNVTIPTLPGISTIRQVIPDDLVLISSGTLPGIGRSSYSSEPYTVSAISLNPSTRGQLLWSKEYAAPAGNVTVSFGPTDPDPATRVFTIFLKETISWAGYSLDDGSLLWTSESENPWNFYSGAGGALMTSTAAYGKLYSTGYSGTVYCYDLADGTLLWEYNAEAGFATPYGSYPLGITAVADGKIYLNTNEHSSGAPYWKGAKLRCLDANTGEELWTIASHGASTYGNYGSAVADGYLVHLNVYDMQVYCMGKGPSAITVEAPMITLSLGDSVVIRGTVTDQCAGAKQLVEAGKFSYVPAISDGDMGRWMEYLYMQKPMPTDAEGVEVVLTTLDPNGNTYELGRTTTDVSGTFGIAVDPPVQGLYKIIATFKGSESYYGSSAVTYINVEEAPSATQSMEPELTATNPTATTETTFITTEAAILATVAVVCIIGVVAFWTLRKRK
jgi:hypothetical protein